MPILLLLALFCQLPLICGQSQTDPGPSFTAASVFPTDIGCRDQIYRQCPSGATAVDATSPFQSDGRYRACGDLEKFLRDATGNKTRLWDVPAWGSRDLYDIDAKGPDGASVEQLRGRLRDLLEKRFQLKFHFETRMIDVYVLKVAEGGPRLQPAKDDNGIPLIELPRGPVEPCEDLFRPGSMRNGVEAGGLSTLEARAVSINTLAGFLVNATGCTVVDRTGVEGLFDIKLRYRPYRAHVRPSVACSTALNPSASGSAGPSIFSALEQSGLKLEPAKVPLELLIIDNAQKPGCTDASGAVPCRGLEF